MPAFAGMTAELKLKLIMHQLVLGDEEELLTAR
jgi:hypothetical protein